MSNTTHNARRTKQVTVALTEAEAAFLDVLAHRNGVSRPSLMRAYAFNGIVRHLMDIDDPLQPVVAVTSSGARFGVPRRSAVESAHRKLRKEGLLQAVLDALNAVEELPLPQQQESAATPLRAVQDHGRDLMESSRNVMERYRANTQKWAEEHERRMQALKDQSAERAERSRRSHQEWRLRTAREDDVLYEPERRRREEVLGRPVEPWWSTAAQVRAQIRAENSS